MSDILIFFTDHVLIWYEYVGNYTCRKKDSGRCSVKTGGKENNWFTYQISIGRGRMECITYVIFKGKDSICCIHYFYVILHYMMNHISFSHLLFFQSVPANPG